MVTLTHEFLRHAACARHVHSDGLSTDIPSEYPIYFTQKITALRRLGYKIQQRCSAKARGLYTIPQNKKQRTTAARIQKHVFDEQGARQFPHSLFIGPDDHLLYMLFVELGSLAVPTPFNSSGALIRRGRLLTPYIDFNLVTYSTDAADRLAAWLYNSYSLNTRSVREAGCPRVRIYDTTSVLGYIDCISSYTTADTRQVVTVANLFKGDREYVS